MTDFPVFMPAVPEIVLACAGMALLMLGVFRGGNSTRLVAQLSVAVLIFVAILVIGHGSGRATAFYGQFVMDGFGVFTKTLVLIGAALTILLSLGFIEREQMNRFEFPVLMLLATVGMLMMISANDLMSLYLGLETQSLGLYVIASFRRDAARSAEAGLKYFVLGALSSGLLLFGSSMIYGFTGTTSFEKIAAVLAAAHGPHAGVILGMVFIAAGLAFKISAVPFHMWTPDVYEGAPTPVTAFFAAAPKVAAFALFLRVLSGPFGSMVAQWQQIVIFAALGSMVLGAFTAIHQTNIKRLMAYSSIGHVGFALTGLAAGSEQGVRGVLVYLAIYVAMSVGTFGVILCMRRDGRMVEEISDLAGLSKTHPLLAAVMTVFMFSMAGIPPLAGFFGKLYVFLAAIQAELYTLAIIGVLSSVVGAYYYLRIIKVMYFDEVAEPLDRQDDDPITWVLAGTGVFILLFFVFPAPVLNSAAAAAASLFGS
ncbi:NADH-quinone oxidoreductase subunit N [Azospirillaceae bacterium]